MFPPFWMQQGRGEGDHMLSVDLYSSLIINKLTFLITEGTGGMEVLCRTLHAPAQLVTMVSGARNS